MLFLHLKEQREQRTMIGYSKSKWRTNKSTIKSLTIFIISFILFIGIIIGSLTFMSTQSAPRNLQSNSSGSPSSPSLMPASIDITLTWHPLEGDEFDCKCNADVDGQNWKDTLSQKFAEQDLTQFEDPIASVWEYSISAAEEAFDVLQASSSLEIYQRSTKSEDDDIEIF